MSKPNNKKESAAWDEWIKVVKARGNLAAAISVHSYRNSFSLTSKMLVKKRIKIKI